MKSVLTPIAEDVAQKRYYHKDDQGKPIEDWEGLSWRVVNHVCAKEDDKFKKQVFDLICGTKFLPNSPCLVNAGRLGKSKGLLACFVTKSPDDTWIGMVENIANFGHIARQGGGCGVSFSKIRPEGDPVFGSTHARACGPIEHMRMVSEVMSSITQAGFRGMAMMGTIDVRHPDLMKFIVCKQRDRALKTYLKEDIFNHYEQFRGNLSEQMNVVLDKFIYNFNISVVVNDQFMKAVLEDGDWELSFNDKVYETLKARDIFDAIVKNAWQNGDPGLLFWDTMNSGPYRYSEQWINATNPCGEQVLPEFGSCNLGSIDVSKFYDETLGEIDWKSLRKAIQAGTQFLDDVIDVNVFPTEDFAKWAKDNRPVGLGIMGLADLFLKMKLAYGSEESLQYAEKIAAFFAKEARAKSVELGKERGTPAACRFKELDFRRNATNISIAPTGTIAQLAGCSHAIEPLYAPTVYRYDNTGEKKLGTHPLADESYFRCAVASDLSKQITWEQHVDMQAAFQKHCDSAISKTINMPNDAIESDVASAYMRAWKGGCKGITIYRDGSKTTQVLMTDTKDVENRPKSLPCQINKTRAEGVDWHVIVGLLNDRPYELFAINGRVELPKKGYVVKRKRRHYSLLDEEGSVLVENLSEEESHISPKVGLETRRFSLELRNGINPEEIVEQIDKSTETMSSFSKAVSRMFKKNNYVKLTDLQIMCPDCAKEGRESKLIPEAGCYHCPFCTHSVCG